MIFSIISMVSLFEVDNDSIDTDDSVSAGREKTYILHCATLMQLDLECKWTKKNHTAKLIYPNRNGMVWHLAVSTRTLGPVHSWRGSVGNESLHLYFISST